MTALISYVLSLFSKAGPPTTRTNKYALPLPNTRHVVLDEATIAGRHVFIVGDVHGCYDEMCEMLDLAARERGTLSRAAGSNMSDDNNNILFIFAGDLINKGPKNVKVIRKIRDMSTKGCVYAVRGNHEECVLREVRDRQASPDYKLQDKYQWITGLSIADINFIQELPYTISIPSLSVTVLHAGLLPNIPLEEQNLYHFTNMRNVILHQNAASNKDKLEGISKTDRGESWTSFWRGPEHVYFGHDARRGLQQCEFATGLDTGCLYGNSLTGVFVTGERQILSVKAKQCYSKPDE